jgi:hypothetical protein
MKNEPVAKIGEQKVKHLPSPYREHSAKRICGFISINHGGQVHMSNTFTDCFFHLCRVFFFVSLCYFILPGIISLSSAPA